MTLIALPSHLAPRQKVAFFLSSVRHAQGVPYVLIITSSCLYVNKMHEIGENMKLMIIRILWNKLFWSYLFLGYGG